MRCPPAQELSRRVRLRAWNTAISRRLSGSFLIKKKITRKNKLLV